MLHGLTGSGEDWQHVFAHPLAGYRPIAPDLRGHGSSTNPGGQFRFADVARDMFALLDHLTIQRVKAIGLSVSHTFPSDYRVALNAVNKGRPLALDNHNELSDSFRQFAQEVSGLRPKRDGAKAAGLFGRLTQRRV